MVFPMPDVFEEAVQQAVKTLLDDTPYTMTEKDLGTVARRVGPDQNDTRDLEPDIVIRRKTQSDDKGPVVAVGDVKWKTDEKPSSGDFYQLATYQAYADVPGIVVYPEKETDEHDLEYVSTDSASNRGNLLIRTIDISSSDSYQSFIDQLIGSLSGPVTQLLTRTKFQNQAI
jgi:5-methylcytosine-specific restriction endonuclease McrBC regulatory subunit McrC